MLRDLAMWAESTRERNHQNGPPLLAESLWFMFARSDHWKMESIIILKSYRNIPDIFTEEVTAESWCGQRKKLHKPDLYFTAGDQGQCLGGELGWGFHWRWGGEWGEWSPRSWLRPPLAGPLDWPKHLKASWARGQQPDPATGFPEDPADPRSWQWEGTGEGNTEIPPLGVGGKLRGSESWWTLAAEMLKPREDKSFKQLLNNKYEEKKSQKSEEEPQGKFPKTN